VNKDNANTPRLAFILGRLGTATEILALDNLAGREENELSHWPAQQKEYEEPQGLGEAWIWVPARQTNLGCRTSVLKTCVNAQVFT
jgi:hypothetical protein